MGVEGISISFDLLHQGFGSCQQVAHSMGTLHSHHCFDIPSPSSLSPSGALSCSPYTDSFTNTLSLKEGEGTQPVPTVAF